MNHLNHSKKCPLHNSYFCCGRERNIRVPKFSKWETVRPGVRRRLDEHSKTGWRWKLSEARKREVKDQQLRQSKLCRICGEPLEDYRDVVLDHIEPKGMGGAWADDGENGSNLQVTHKWCNRDKGSRRAA